VVDGQENPVMNIHASKLYEVQKHLALTSHQFQITPFLMSKRSWDRLSDADKKAVQEAAAEATALQRKLSQESEDKLLADLKSKGVLVTTVDKGRVPEGNCAGGRQMARRADRPVRQEGRRRRPRQLKRRIQALIDTPGRRRPGAPRGDKR
jgi:TRAP-type C4-dicarboxylate transport system substrate-binding protein